MHAGTDEPVIVRVSGNDHDAQCPERTGHTARYRSLSPVPADPLVMLTNQASAALYRLVDEDQYSASLMWLNPAVLRPAAIVVSGPLPSYPRLRAYSINDWNSSFVGRRHAFDPA